MTGTAGRVGDVPFAPPRLASPATAAVTTSAGCSDSPSHGVTREAPDTTHVLGCGEDLSTGRRAFLAISVTLRLLQEPVRSVCDPLPSGLWGLWLKTRRQACGLGHDHRLQTSFIALVIYNGP